jgi:hypothetical protein
MLKRVGIALPLSLGWSLEEAHQVGKRVGGLVIQGLGSDAGIVDFEQAMELIAFKNRAVAKLAPEEADNFLMYDELTSVLAALLDRFLEPFFYRTQKSSFPFARALSGRTRFCRPATPFS